MILGLTGRNNVIVTLILTMILNKLFFFYYESRCTILKIEAKKEKKLVAGYFFSSDQTITFFVQLTRISNLCKFCSSFMLIWVYHPYKHGINGYKLGSQISHQFFHFSLKMFFLLKIK